MPFALMILIIMPLQASANIWRATFGQQWFYEVRSSGGEALAGTWWESSLQPGNTYEIHFEVTHLRGRVGLFAGGNDMLVIDRTGNFDFQFMVPEDGKQRRLMFSAISSNVLAGVRNIQVTQTWSAQAHGDDSANDGAGSGHDTAGSSDGIPKGHYIGFARERNLKHEVIDVLDQPDRAGSYALRRARELDDALTTPGVKGFSVDVDWRTLETGDGVFNWRLVDDNMALARRYGLKFVVKVSDRSFDGTNILPRYFPSRYVGWTTGNGKSGYVSKRWEPYVYERMIRLYRAIANRYRNDEGFGGIATTETAVGSVSGYSASAYRTALTQIITQTSSAMTRGRLFWYLNFVRGGDNIDMNRDARVDMVRAVPRGNLVIGAPDITPDVAGMPGSVSAYRKYVRKTLPDTEQFCHLQHVDQGMGGKNVKSNQHRRDYQDRVATQRQREQQSWYSGQPGAFEFDDLRDPQGRRVDYHPSWLLGELWTPAELVDYADRNFDCDYFFWNYRPNMPENQFDWDDVQPVILNNQYFYE